MGWLSLLADLGLAAGAPFTGGATLAAIPLANSAINGLQNGGSNNSNATAADILNGVGAGSSVLGAQQQGRATGALAQAGAQQNQDRNAINLYQAQQAAQNEAAQTDLERQQFATNNRGQTAKQALIGALLSGYTPYSVSGGQVQGGLARSLASNPSALAAMKTLNSQASTAQNTPLSFTGGNLVTAPTLTPLPNLGSLNSALSNVANIGQIAGATAPSILDILQRLNPQNQGNSNVYGSSSAASGYGGGF